MSSNDSYIDARGNRVSGKHRDEEDEETVRRAGNNGVIELHGEELAASYGAGGQIRNRKSLQAKEFQHDEEAGLFERPDILAENAPYGIERERDEAIIKMNDARNQVRESAAGKQLGYELNVDGNQRDLPGSYYGIFPGTISVPKKKSTEIATFIMRTATEKSMGALEETLRGMYVTCSAKDEKISKMTGQYLGLENDIGVPYLQKAYELFYLMIEKIIKEPKNPLFRAVRMSHREMATFIFDEEKMLGALDVLLLTGWELCPEDEDVLYLPMQFKYKASDLDMIRKLWMWVLRDAEADTYQLRRSCEAMLAN